MQAKAEKLKNIRSIQKGLLTRLTILAVLVLLVGQIVVAWFALHGFEQELEPQLNRKANTVGNSVVDRISYAIDTLQISSSGLVGVESYFDEVLMDNSDIAYLAYRNDDSELLFVRGVSSGLMNTIISNSSSDSGNFNIETQGYLNGRFAVEELDGSISYLHVGVLSEHIRNQLSEVILELLTVIAISWLVTFELLAFFMGSHVFEPLDEIRRAIMDGASGKFTNKLLSKTRDEMGVLTSSFNRMLNSIQNRYNDFVFEVNELKDAQIDDSIARKISKTHDTIVDRFSLSGSSTVRTASPNQIRVPLFLFIFSEELSRSFLPLFINQYVPSDLVASQDFLIGLPITMFMLAAMIATPIGGGMVDRYGVRRVFLAGVLVATAGFIGNFLTQGYIDLIIYRVLTGIGYGLVFISSEGWVTSQAKPHSRATSTGVFVSAVFTGIICGPSIGGIIADRIGFEATFLISALLAITSGWIVYQIFRQSESVVSENKMKPITIGAQNWFVLLKDIRFVAVLVFSAVPGKMMVAGFIAYLVPLYLSDLGHSASSIGRIMMLYGLATICVISLAARFADHSGKYGAVVSLGGVIAGIGCLTSYFAEGLGASNTVVVAILTLGVGHGLSLTSQNSLIQMVAVRYRNTMGSASVIGAYRLIERLGMVLGPLIAVGLVTSFGFQGAIIAFGFILLGLISLFITTVMMSRNSSATG